MASVRAWLELARASNLPTVWTNALCAAVLAGGELVSARGAAATAAVSLLYVAGMSLNDLLDVEEDRVRKPARPLPSGRISLRGAALFTGGLLLTAMASLGVFCGWKSVWWGLALSVAVLLYDALHRKQPATVLLMAACRALVFPVVASALVGAVSLSVAVAAGIQFTYVVALTLVARWEKTASRRPVLPIPWLLAGISLVDGAVLAVLRHPAWLLAGLAGALLTRAGQRWVPGD